jgi:hypothetical protein
VKSLPRYAVIIAALILSVYSCRKDEILTDTNATLRFSEDTIIFDTVFVTVGSATEVFKIYNDYDADINISSLRLATGNASRFRLNVDGMPGKIFSNVQIRAKDSLFIFVEVTIDPNSANLPFVVTDSIIFVTNGNIQDIDLVAWGQNAVFHKPSPGNNAQLVCNEVWIDTLPHVIYGYVIVNENCSLTVEKGTNVFLHPGSGIIVLSGGTLLVNGEKDSIVTFTGDRLEADYRETPGQWDRIHLSNISLANLTGSSDAISGGTHNSVINYAVIKNGNIGLLVDTVFGNMSDPGYTLTLNNTIITNMAGSSLVARGTKIKSGNCVFANASQFAAALAYGGRYDFRHCTFANYWNYSNRTTPTLLINNFFSTYLRPIDSAYFGNCIVYGNLNDGKEVGLDSMSTSGSNFNYFFDHSLIRTGGSIPINAVHFNTVVTDQDPKFKDYGNNNYELDTLSNAKDKGIFSISSPDYVHDIKDVDRNLYLPPDCGAYERPQ